MYLLSSVFCCCVSHKENQSFEWQQGGRLWERLMFPTPVFLFAQGKHCAIHNVLYLFISPPNIRFSSLIFSEGVFRSTATVDSFTEKQCVWWLENWWVLPLTCTSTPTPGSHWWLWQVMTRKTMTFGFHTFPMWDLSVTLLMAFDESWCWCQ